MEVGYALFRVMCADTGIAKTTIHDFQVDDTTPILVWRSNNITFFYSGRSKIFRTQNLYIGVPYKFGTPTKFQNYLRPH
jgi:hypothetical protein